MRKIDEGGRQKVEQSKETLAFKLFLEGRTSVEVLIALDIKAQDAETLHLEFLRLSGLDKLVMTYKESGLDIQLLLNLFRLTYCVKMVGVRTQS